MPVKLGAKYSAEHESLGYHQADIRELEIPRSDRMETGLFSLSNGARRFTRYGYADFFQQGSRYKVLFRLWPGTQRHLLSADPEMAAAFGRTSNFCGAAGLELCEPLTFKGREGSGQPGGRCAYADSSLNPFRRGRRVDGNGCGKRFPCSSFGHDSPSFLSLEPLLLARDLRQYADCYRQRTFALQRIGLGQFFAAKLRSGALFEIYKQIGDADAAKLAVEQYVNARNSWDTMARRVQKVYRANITYGSVPIRQGHWMDRLEGIDKDVRAMQAVLQHKPDIQAGSQQNGQQAIRAILQPPHRPSFACNHTPPQVFQPGDLSPLSLSLNNRNGTAPLSSALLIYRHVNQGERWRTAEMEQAGTAFQSAIPGDYTNSPFPLQYLFEFRRGSSEAWLYPAFNKSLSNQPYFAVYKRKA